MSGEPSRMELAREILTNAGWPRADIDYGLERRRGDIDPITWARLYVSDPRLHYFVAVAREHGEP